MSLWALLQKADPRLVGVDVSALKGWELRPVGTSAVLMINGPEIHVAALKDVRGRWITRKAIRENLCPLLQKYGLLTTKVMHDNPAGQDFVQRIGFHEIRRDERMRYYELKELRHA